MHAPRPASRVSTRFSWHRAGLSRGSGFAPRPLPEAGRWLLADVAGPNGLTLGAMHVPNRVTGRKFPFLDAVLGWLTRGGEALRSWSVTRTRD